MSDVIIRPYEETLRGEWDNVVISSKNGTFLHLRAYIDYHAHRFDERSLIVEYKNNPVAVFPCNIDGREVISHSGLTYGGLIYSHVLRTTQLIEIFEMIFEHFKKLGAIKLIYKAIPHIYHRYPSEEDLYALFRMGGRVFRRDIASVIPFENRMNVTELRKRQINRARKNNLVVRENELLSEYHKILTGVLARFGVRPVHEIEEMCLLKNRFPENIQLFSAFKADDMLAGALVYDFGRIAHTQYLASTEEGKETGALDLVISYLIERYSTSHNYLSFGISTEMNGMYLNEGLIFQKEGFGGRGIVLDQYEVEF